MVTIIYSPAHGVSLSGSPVVFGLQTDNRKINPGVAASATFYISSKIEDGTTFVMSTPFFNQTFWASSYPDEDWADGGIRFISDVLSVSSLTLIQYVDLVVSQIARHAIIYENYNVERVDADDFQGIVFTAKNIGELYSINLGQNTQGTGFPLPIFISNANIVLGESEVIRPNFKIRADLHILNLNTGESKKVASYPLVPDAQEQCWIDLSYALQPFTTTTLPVAGGTVPLEDPISPIAYFISYAESYGNPQVLKPMVNSSVFYTFAGGQGADDHLANNFIVKLFTAPKLPFLSHRPLARLASRALLQVEVNSVYLHAVTQVLTPCAEVYLSDGSISVITSAALPIKAKKLYHIPFLPIYQSALALETGGKKIISIGYYLRGANGAPFTDRIEYTIDERYHMYERLYLMQNSLGGWDTFNCTGDIVRNVEPSANVAQRIIPTPYTALDNGMVRYGTAATKGNVAHTGYQSKAYVRYLSEQLTYSLSMWEIIGNRYVPIIVRSKAEKTYKEQDSLFSLVIDYMYAFTFNNYSSL